VKVDLKMLLSIDIIGARNVVGEEEVKDSENISGRKATLEKRMISGVVCEREPVGYV
jgi:hypothetical protein